MAVFAKMTKLFTELHDQYLWYWYYLFFQGNEMKIQTIFESFEQFQLGRNSLDQLYSWIVAGLEK